MDPAQKLALRTDTSLKAQVGLSVPCANNAAGLLEVGVDIGVRVFQVTEGLVHRWEA